MTKRIYWLIMSIVILLPLMIVTIIDHGSYSYGLLILVVPMGLLLVFVTHKVLVKKIDIELKEADILDSKNKVKYKYLKMVIASYVLSIVFTAMASFFTLAVGVVSYSNFIDNNAKIIVLVGTIILMPFVAKYIK